MILKEIRESCKLSTSELSRLSGIHRRDIYNLETGRYCKKAKFYKLVETLASKVELAYIAGLVDRCSSINIGKNKAGATNTSKHPHYIAKFIVTSIHEEIPEIIRTVLGVGETTTVKSYNGSRDHYYSYYAHNQAAGKALEKLLPYLKIKRQKAQILLDFRKEMEFNKSQRDYLYSIHGPGYEWDQDEINAEYDKYYQRIRECP